MATCTLPLLMTGCGGAGNESATTIEAALKSMDKAAVTSAQILKANLTIDLTAKGIAANTAILGNNVQWINNGDGLVLSNGQSNTTLVNTLKQMGATVLRYPGGALADTYHWRDGIGAIGTRGSDRTLDNKTQKIILGSNEFLQIAGALQAVPIFTTNVVTGTAQEAADWVGYVNGTGTQQIERVQFWEIGNEPYITEDLRPDLALRPEEYAQRANNFIHAMRAVDPNIKVGLPLRSDTIGNVPTTAYPGYNRTVLTGVTESIDFVTVHNGYVPFIYSDEYVSDEDLFTAAMAASNVLSSDLDATSAQIKVLRPEGSLPIAVTEYNALFGLNSARLVQYSSSLAGALYVADALRIMATRSDIISANIWSMSGNGYFGVVDNSGQPRPAYYVLSAYRKLLQGQVLNAQPITPVFANRTTGAVPSGSSTPLIGTLVTRQDKMLRIALINKHISSSVSMTLNLTNGSASSGITVSQLNGTQLFSGATGHTPVSWITQNFPGSGTQLTLQLPAHSFILYEIPLI